MRRLITAFGVLLFVGMLYRLDRLERFEAWAAVTPNSAVTPQTPNRGIAQVLNATGAITIANNAASASNTVTLYTCGTNGSKITGMFAGSTDSVARDLQVLLINTSKVYVVTTITVPIGAGTVAGTPVVNMLSPANTPGLPVDKDGNPYLSCVTGDTIVVGTKVAPTSNLAVTVVAQAADF